MFGIILLATLIGSLIAMIGGILLLWYEKYVKKHLLTLVSFAAGSLLGAAYLELLPEAIEAYPLRTVGSAMIAGILTLFVLEKVLEWYHSHEESEQKILSTTVLIGDSFHNFIDGIIIALSFGIGGMQVGIASTIAVFLHEIPQEIGDFAILMHAGYSKKKVILYNALTALTAVVGGIIGYFLLETIEPYIGIFVAVAAGFFTYISVSDLLPELKHKTAGRDLGHLVALLLGVLVIWSLGAYFPE